MVEEPLLEVEGVSRRFDLGRKGWRGGRRLVEAVRDVSFSIRAGEAFGLVGESGCGKSTLAKVILNMHAPSTGTIRFEGRTLTGLAGREWRSLRHKIQYVFQDPLAALDPRRSALFQVMEPLVIHGIGGSRKNRMKAAHAVLRKVGLGPENDNRFPHQLSGGQRQRVILARALVLQPKLLICDEPVSALDVSVQAQVVNLLRELWRESDLTLLFISHDLSLVHYLCERVAVMYLGRICEIAPTEKLFSAPRHPYTQSLLSAIPIPDPSHRQAIIELPGDPPDPANPPPGCPFQSRCPRALPRCRDRQPDLKPIEPGHAVSCHLVHEEA